MSESKDEPEDFASLLAEFEKDTGSGRRRELEPGERVRGRVVSIGAEAAFIDLGGKSDGMIELADLRDEGGQLTIAVGDELEALVVETAGGCVVLRRSLGRGSSPVARAELAQAHEHQLPVEGVVTGAIKGGVEVQIAGVRAFCPISQLDLRHVEGDGAAFVGQRLSFRITRYEESGRGLNLVVSRRALLEEEAKEQASVTRERLSPGAVLRGRVTAIKDYGAFVDLGGIEGMVHVSELGFSRVAHPKDVLALGQEVEVQVLRMDKSDDPRRPEKVALSLKSLARDPWLDVAARFGEGARASGTVVRTESFGAFVELAPGLEGLLHVSELASGRNVRHARDLVKVGQKLEVVVLGVEPERRRLSLGLAGEADEVGEPSSAPAGAAKFGTFADLLKGKKK